MILFLELYIFLKFYLTYLYYLGIEQNAQMSSHKMLLAHNRDVHIEPRLWQK